MKRFAAAMALAWLQACAVAPAATDAGDDVAQLTRQSNAWDDAIVRKDERAIAANMADDFRQIDGDSDGETKASFVAGLMDPGLRIDPYAVADFEARLSATPRC